jgi:hypothetical protein
MPRETCLALGVRDLTRILVVVDLGVAEIIMEVSNHNKEVINLVLRRGF